MLFDRSDPASFWLDITNAFLGLLVVVPLLYVIYEMAWELPSYLRERRLRRAADKPHTLPTPDLGMTMADGGTPCEEEGERRESSDSEEDSHSGGLSS